MKQFSLACGIEVSVSGDADLAAWACYGIGVWFLAAPRGSEGTRWSLAVDRAAASGAPSGATCWTQDDEGEHCRTAFGTIVLKARDRVCHLTMTDRRGMGHLMHLAMGAMLRHHPRLQLHAAVLAPEPRTQAVVMAGASGSGKTTLTMNLARRGWRFLSDDSVALQADASGLCALPIRQRFMLVLEGTTFKCAVDPDDEFPGQRLWRAQVGALVFLDRGGEACSITSLSRIEALSRLPALTNEFLPQSGGWQIKVLARLASLPAFVLHSGADVLRGGGSADRALRACLHAAALT